MYIYNLETKLQNNRWIWKEEAPPGQVEEYSFINKKGDGHHFLRQGGNGVYLHTSKEEPCN